MHVETSLPHPRMALSDDGQTLAVEAGAAVQVWRQGEQMQLRSARHIGPLALSPAGDELFVGEASLAVVSLPSQARWWSLKTKDGADPVVFGADAQAVFFREVGKNLRRVDVATGEDTASASVKSVREKYFGKIVSLGLSRSGAVLGSVVQRRGALDLVRWRADTLEPLDVRETKWAVVSGRGGGAVLETAAGLRWLDLDAPEQQRSFDGVEIMDPLTQVCIDPSGRYVGLLDGFPVDPWMPMSVWDTLENREVARLDDESRGQAKLLGPEAAFVVVHRGSTVERLDL